MTAYDTGTSGFNITVAVGKMLKDKYGSDARVLPAGNDVARLQPLRLGRASISAMGVGVYFAQEGVFEFATREWGPQPLQITLSSLDCNGLSLAVAGDTGVKTYADLKGKRIGFVVGSPALNQNALAMLAFANLTAKDVKIVEFSSNDAMWKGMMNNDTDAGIRFDDLRARQGIADVAARHRLAGDAVHRQGRLGAHAQGRPVLHRA